MKECRLLDDSGSWSPLEDDPEDARRIIPVFQWAFGETYGRVWLSRAVAGWVARVCGVADPPPAWAWSFAKAYQWATQRQEPTRCLDLALMQRVWEMTEGESLKAFSDNADRQERLRQACQLASPTTWKRQWDDLMGFWQWSAQSNMLPPWEDNENESIETATG
jgi:hypothetical protein